jgi:hypothetical protein
MRGRFLLLAPLLIPGLLEAQTVRGVVVEYGTRNTIAGATIEVFDRKGASFAATSDNRLCHHPRTAGRMTVHATVPRSAQYGPYRHRRQEGDGHAVRPLTQAAIPIAPIVYRPLRSALSSFYERERRNASGSTSTRRNRRQRPVSVSIHARHCGVEFAGEDAVRQCSPAGTTSSLT